jgi:hypothetical protein
MWIDTMPDFKKDVINTLQREHPLLDKISGKGNFQAKEGGKGKRVIETILTRNNNNVRYVSFDAIITKTNVDLLAQIEWDWKFMYADFVMLDKVLEMSHTHELVNIMTQQQEALRKGFQEHLAKQLYAHGGNTLEIGGLKYLLPKNPYCFIENGVVNSNTGLPDGTETYRLVCMNLKRSGAPGDKREWWRNRIAAFPANFGKVSANYIDDCTKLVQTMRRMRRIISNGENGLDGIYCSYDLYEMYQTYLENKMRYYVERRPQDKMDSAFASLDFDGLPIYLDKYCHKGMMYFINTDYFHFKYLDGQNFKQEIRQVPDQWAKQYITTFIGNFVMNKPHSNGVLWVANATEPEPDYIYKGIFTGADCLTYETNCTYNIAKWDTFVDRDYGVVTGEKMYGDGSIEHTDYSGSGVYVDPEEYGPLS